MAVMSKGLREQWFHRGVEAFQRAAPGAPEAYPCPLCARGFSREALDDRTLTIEHAPPESLGGRPVCLTCKECNSSAGHTVDAHMQRRERAFDFLAGTMDQPLPARFKVGGLCVNVDYYNGPGGVLVTGDPKRNAPEAQARFEAAFEHAARTGSTADLRFDVTPLKIGHHQRLSSVGWLRSAFLVAFAALGYRYIFQRRLDPVRRQLRSPEETVIGCFSVIVPRAKAEERQFFFVEEPSHLRGLLLQMGRALVFLPWLHDGLYETMRDTQTPDREFQAQIHGKTLPWPKEPLHLLDYDRLPGITYHRVSD